MAQAQYEVIYIDKFTDAAKANFTRTKMRNLFHLNDKHLDKLGSGDPVVIKKKVSLEEATRYREAVRRVGGVAWVQELSADGVHRERRQGQRRCLPDRRATFRASSIQPDRRQSCGRRSTDGAMLH